MGVKYALRVLSGVTPKKLMVVVNNVHEKTKKNKIAIFFDILWCAIRYGAGYNDYEIFAFYDIKHDKRKTFVTRFKNKKMIMMLNNQDYADLFDKKNQFNKRFSKYLKREFLDMTSPNFNDFVNFVKDKEVIFAKPNNGDSGRGIERLVVKDYKSEKELYDYIVSKNFGVIEQEVKQHSEMARLHPNSVNCIRIQTIVVDKKPHFVYAACKAGNSGHFVDNLGFDGINIPVIPETGELVELGRTEHKQTFTKHPYTNVEFKGFKIPYFKEAVDMCFEAALEVEQVGFVGWDVFIGEDGPGIIEGNDYPDYYFWQLPEHNPERIGLLPFYKSLLPKL